MGEERKHPTQKITARLLASLRPEEKPYVQWDLLIPGFGVRVLPSGVMTFYLKGNLTRAGEWHKIGRTRDFTLDEARSRANALRGQIREGTDPRVGVRERKLAPSVADLAMRFLAEHCQVENAPSTAKEQARLYEKHVRPALGLLKVRSIGPGDIAALLHAVGHGTPARAGTPTEANRLRSFLSAMFKAAERWGFREPGTNPVAMQLRNREAKRERRLTDLELANLGQILRDGCLAPEKEKAMLRAIELGERAGAVAEAFGVTEAWVHKLNSDHLKTTNGEREARPKSPEAPAVCAAVRLAVMAGMRKGEILNLRWEWVDLGAGTIRIPAKEHKSGRKTGKVRVVYLCRALRGHLRELPTFGNPFVIAGERPGGHLVNLQSPWERIREAAGLAVLESPSEDDPGLHDLRRTFGSIGADLGLKGFVGELLGHSEKTVTDIYTRSAAARLLEAAETIGGRIEAILSGAIDPRTEGLEAVSAPR